MKHWNWSNLVRDRCCIFSLIDYHSILCSSVPIPCCIVKLLLRMCAFYFLSICFCFFLALNCCGFTSKTTKYLLTLMIISPFNRTTGKCARTNDFANVKTTTTKTFSSNVLNASDIRIKKKNKPNRNGGTKRNQTKLRRIDGEEKWYGILFLIQLTFCFSPTAAIAVFMVVCFDSKTTYANIELSSFQFLCWIRKYLNLFGGDHWIWSRIVFNCKVFVPIFSLHRNHLICFPFQ